MIVLLLAALAGFILSVSLFDKVTKMVGKTYTLNDKETWLVRGVGALFSGVTLTLYIIVVVIEEIIKMAKD